MSDLNQDVQKVAADTKATVTSVDAAAQRALNAVNRQATWVERHPKLALGIVVAAVLIAVGCIVHAL